MPTFKPVVYAHHKRADGSYNIKIRITHKRKSRWLPTNLTAYACDLTRGHKLRNKDLEWRCSELIREMRSALSDLPLFALEDKDVDWVVKHIKDKLSGRAFSLDFFAFVEEFLSSTKKPATAALYRTALNSFRAYLGRSSLDVNEINRPMLLAFAEWVENSPRVSPRADVGTRGTEISQ